MIGVLITTHGTFASGIYESLEMIFGVNDNIVKLDFKKEMSADELSKKIVSEIDDLLKKVDGVICLTDIKGGTPFRICAEQSIYNKKLAVISGLNLPMLISVASEMDDITLDEAIEIALDSKNEIEEFKLNIKKESLDSDDGI